MSYKVVEILPESTLRNLQDITFIFLPSFLETRSHFLFSFPRRGYSTISSIHRAFPLILGHRSIRLLRERERDLGRDPILN